MKKKLCIGLAAALLVSMLGFGGGALAAGKNTTGGQVFSAITGLTATTDINTLIPYFMVKADTYYNTAGYSSNHYDYTEEELKMLAIVIHLEVKGQPYKAKLAVGNVVMNRVLSRGYPGDNIKDVVTRPNQFAYNPNCTPSAECMKAARDVLIHEVWVVPQNTYFFKVTQSKSGWGRHTYYAHIGVTAFYQDSYAGRVNVNTIPPAMFERVYKWPQVGCKPAARVRKIQIMLNSMGNKLTTDGWFGQGTKDALVKFQQANGLKADGIAGPATLKSLIKKYGVSKYLKLKG